MRLAPLYEQDREQAIQQGETKVVLRQLKRRFGELPPHITETIQKLSVEKLEDLGEALLDFKSQADLINWLNQT
jgi:hypothetical protein